MARSGGRRKGTYPLHSRATAAMLGSSVEQSTLDSQGRIAAVRRAVRTARATSGMPATVARFLRGTPLEPPRAGTMKRHLTFLSRIPFPRCGVNRLRRRLARWSFQFEVATA